MKHEELTSDIIKVFYKVYNCLGYGFLEKIYENAMCIELQEHGLHVQTQRKIEVCYKNQLVGTYCADIIVNDLVVLELKANEFLKEENGTQLLNYLRATDKEVGLLLNFGKIPQLKRQVFDNAKKIGVKKHD